MGTGPIGALLVGYLAEYFGPQESIFICSLAMLAVILVVSLTTKIWDTKFVNGGDEPELGNSIEKGSASIP